MLFTINYTYGLNNQYFRGGKSDPFASLGALTGIAPKSAPTPSLSMNQQQQQQNNQFNQYMNNNVGAPASTVKIYILRFLSHNLCLNKALINMNYLEWQFNGCIIWMKILLFGSISKPAGLF